MTVDAVIFDFDGVVADSEGLACEVLARLATELGVPMSQREALDRFTGKRIGEVTAAVEQLANRSLPNFAEELQKRTLAAFETDLHEVAGVGRFLAEHQNIKRCIASSSAPKRIKFCLSILKLGSYFGENIFSAEQVARGKPYPDIFLFAAEQMGMEKPDIVVIEDSPGGVKAAVAAGMNVIGLLAATHLLPSHGDVLRAAGANLIAADYDEVSAIIARL
jgi:HAD superfamily hydrolase (TIGR01509 family)